MASSFALVTKSASDTRVMPLRSAHLFDGVVSFFPMTHPISAELSPTPFFTCDTQTAFDVKIGASRDDLQVQSTVSLVMTMPNKRTLVGPTQVGVTIDRENTINEDASIVKHCSLHPESDSSHLVTRFVRTGDKMQMDYLRVDCSLDMFSEQEKRVFRLADDFHQELRSEIGSVYQSIGGASAAAGKAAAKKKSRGSKSRSSRKSRSKSRSKSKGKGSRSRGRSSSAKGRSSSRGRSGSKGRTSSRSSSRGRSGSKGKSSSRSSSKGSSGSKGKSSSRSSSKGSSSSKGKSTSSSSSEGKPKPPATKGTATPKQSTPKAGGKATAAKKPPKSKPAAKPKAQRGRSPDSSQKGKGKKQTTNKTQVKPAQPSSKSGGSGGGGSGDAATAASPGTASAATPPTDSTAVPFQGGGGGASVMVTPSSSFPGSAAVDNPSIRLAPAPRPMMQQQPYYYSPQQQQQQPYYFDQYGRQVFVPMQSQQQMSPPQQMMTMPQVTAGSGGGGSIQQQPPIRIAPIPGQTITLQQPIIVGEDRIFDDDFTQEDVEQLAKSISEMGARLSSQSASELLPQINSLLNDHWDHDTDRETQIRDLAAHVGSLLTNN